MNFGDGASKRVILLMSDKSFFSGWSFIVGSYVNDMEIAQSMILIETKSVAL